MTKQNYLNKSQINAQKLVSASVKKATGDTEPFKEQKFKESIQRAGGTQMLAQEMAERLQEALQKNQKTESITTEEIHTTTEHLLQKKNCVVAAKYSLKRGMMRLGPSGYIFEKFIAKIFDAYGYSTRIGRIMKGQCVDHEVDIWAEKDLDRMLIECKYHNHSGIKSNIKVALYTQARFEDVISSEQYKHKKDNERQYQPWLVTNTRCTEDAIKYAQCKRLNILAWHYPEKKGLQQYIEEKQLYPITVLPSATKYIVQQLVKKDILIAKELLGKDPKVLERKTKITEEKIQKLQREAFQICTGC